MHHSMTANAYAVDGRKKGRHATSVAPFLEDGQREQPKRTTSRP